MRNKTLLLALVVVVACGAGPFRGGFGLFRPPMSGVPSQPNVYQARQYAPAASQGAEAVSSSSGYNVLSPIDVEAASAASGSSTTVEGTGAGSTTQAGTYSPSSNSAARTFPTYGARQTFPASQGQIAQVAFSARGAEGLTIQWDTIQIGMFESPATPVPFVQNFQTTRSYRLKLTNIPGKPDMTLYPTLTVAGVTPRTRAFLDHNAIPVKFTQSDFDQVENGNFVTKVIFLPSQQDQNLALAGGVDTIVNTQLPPGADPIAEALNRGAILAVVQIGNKDLSIEGSTLDGSLAALTPDAQIPISGVNAPAWGTPAPESEKNMTELPTVSMPEPDPFFTEVRPIPSTSVPPVEPNWSGARISH